MKQYFFKLLFTCFMLSCLSTLGIAQNKVEYTYDMAGNRLTRKVIVMSSGPNSVIRRTEEPDTAVVSDQLLERKISIYPNPTRGMLGVKIEGGEAEEEIRIIVFGGQGAQLLNIKAQKGVNPIDISAYPNGWYILSVRAGTKSKEFKIIKK